MKRLSLMLIHCALLACSSADVVDQEVPSEEPKVEHHESSSFSWWAREESEPQDDEAETHPAVAEWLLRRQATCSQGPNTISAQLARHRRSFATDPDETQAEPIQSQLQALMLASCEPARTPGLLRKFLQHMESSRELSSDYQALFELMAAQLAAYSTLERRYRDLEARHQKTIEGIGNIESILETEAEPEQQD